MVRVMVTGLAVGPSVPRVGAHLDHAEGDNVRRGDGVAQVGRAEEWPNCVDGLWFAALTGCDCR